MLPARTRDQVQRSGAGVLTALAEAVGTCRDALAGKPDANPVPAMRAVDRQVADLRLALLPLLAGRFMMRRSALERPVPALLDCVHWARVLAVSATGPDPAAAAPGRPHRPSTGRPGHRRAPDRHAAGIRRPATFRARGGGARRRLARSTAALTERLAIGALHGFQLER